MSDERPDTPIRLALRAREARLRRGVEEMQWQLRRFRRTMQKIGAPPAPGPGDNPAGGRPDQAAS